MSESKRRTGTNDTPDDATVGHIGDMDVQPGVSRGGHMHPANPPEMPGDAHGAGTAERNRDRSAGVGENLPHEAADVPDTGFIGGQTSSTNAARQILDAIEEREPDRGTQDHTAPSRTVEPLRRPASGDQSRA
jgi:hypothetical protein